MNAYTLWSRHRKRELLQRPRSMTVREMIKIVSAEWKLLTTEEKQPFIDEAERLMGQQNRDNGESICTCLRNSKPSKKSTEPPVVKQNVSPTLGARCLKSNLPVSSFDKENKCNDTKGTTSTNLMPITPYTALSYVSNPHWVGNQPLSSKPTQNSQSKPYNLLPALDADAFMSNRPVSTFDKENKCNDTKGSNFTNLMPFTAYTDSSLVSNLQGVGSRTLSSKKAQNAQSKPYSLLPASDAKDLMSNLPVSVFQTKNKCNDTKDSIPTYLMPLTPYMVPSYTSNPHWEKNQTFTSTSSQNDQFKAYSLLPALEAEAMSDLPVTAFNKENNCNDIKGSIPNYLMPVTPYLAPSFVWNPQWTRRQIFTSMLAHNVKSMRHSLLPALSEECFMSNLPDYDFDKENKCNDTEGCIPTYLMPLAPYIVPSYVSNPQWTGSQAFSSNPAHNTQSKTYSLLPALGAEAFKSNLPVSDFDKENKCNNTKGSVTTYSMPLTPYTVPSGVSNSHFAGSRTFTSMSAHIAQSKRDVCYDNTFTCSGKNPRPELKTRDSVHCNRSSSSSVQNTCPEA